MSSLTASADQNALYVGDETGVLTATSFSLTHNEILDGTIEILSDIKSPFAVTATTTKQNLLDAIGSLSGITIDVVADDVNSTNWTLIVSDANLTDSIGIGLQAESSRTSQPLVLVAQWQQGTLMGESAQVGGLLNESLLILPNISGASNFALEIVGSSTNAVTLDSTDLITTKASIATALSLAITDFNLSYSNSTWTLDFDANPAPSIVLHYDIAGLIDQTEKLVLGFDDTTPQFDNTRLFFENMSTASDINFGGAQIDLSDGLTATEFANAVSGVDATDIIVTVGQNNAKTGWIIDFQGVVAPDLTVLYTFAGGNAGSKQLELVELAYSQQVFSMPLGFEQVEVSYNGSSAIIDLTPYQLDGTETDSDYPIQYSADELVSLFTGISILEDASVNASIEMDPEGIIQFSIVLPSGQTEYFAVEITPIVTPKVEADVQTSVAIANSFVVPVPADNTYLKFAFAPGLVIPDQLLTMTSASGDAAITPAIIEYPSTIPLADDAIKLSLTDNTQLVEVTFTYDGSIWTSSNASYALTDNATNYEITRNSAGTFTLNSADFYVTSNPATMVTPLTTALFQQKLLAYANRQGIDVSSINVSLNDAQDEWAISVYSDQSLQLYYDFNAGGEVVAGQNFADVTNNSVQKIVLPTVEESIQINIGSESVYLYTSATKEVIETALQSLSAVSQASVVLDGSSSWTITFYDARIESQESDYDILNWQAVNDSIDNIAVASSYKTIDRRDDSGIWSVEYDAVNTEQYSVYDYSENTNTGDLLISAVQIIEREVPRALLKDVWDFNDTTGVLEKTGQQDWFLDPRIVTDTSEDNIRITGSEADDYFIIGNQILNEGDADSEETQFDVMQINHTRDSNILKAGSTLTDGVVINLRSFTLTDGRNQRYFKY